MTAVRALVGDPGGPGAEGPSLPTGLGPNPRPLSWLVQFQSLCPLRSPPAPCCKVHSPALLSSSCTSRAATEGAPGEVRRGHGLGPQLLLMDWTEQVMCRPGMRPSQPQGGSRNRFLTSGRRPCAPGWPRIQMLLKVLSSHFLTHLHRAVQSDGHQLQGQWKCAYSELSCSVNVKQAPRFKDLVQNHNIKHSLTMLSIDYTLHDNVLDILSLIIKINFPFLFPS